MIWFTGWGCLGQKQLKPFKDNAGLTAGWMKTSIEARDKSVLGCWLISLYLSESSSLRICCTLTPLDKNPSLQTVPHKHVSVTSEITPLPTERSTTQDAALSLGSVCHLYRSIVPIQLVWKLVEIYCLILGYEIFASTVIAFKFAGCRGKKRTTAQMLLSDPVREVEISFLLLFSRQSNWVSVNKVLIFPP